MLTLICHAKGNYAIILATPVNLTTAHKMTKKKKKIQLIYCGGLGFKKKDQNDRGLKAWLKTMPELIIMGDIVPKYFVSSIKPDHEFIEWQKLAKHIYDQSKKYDGFIVINEIGKLQNAAIALSFILSGLEKPIIFTGEAALASEQNKRMKLNYALGNYGPLSIRANIINALQVANYDLSEIGLMFGSKLIKAVKSRSSHDNINIFNSVERPLASVAFSLKVENRVEKRKRTKISFRPAFDDNVIYLKAYSGFSCQVVEDLSLAKNGIIIDFGHQNISIPGLEKMKANNKAVVLYNMPQPADYKRFTSLSNILPHVLIIKLMWALGQTKDNDEIRKLLLADRCGEFLEKK